MPRDSHPKHDTACCQGASSNAKQTKKSRDSSASGSPPACGLFRETRIRIGFQSHHSFLGVSNRNVQLESFGGADGLVQNLQWTVAYQRKLYLKGPKVPKQILYPATSGFLPSKTIRDNEFNLPGVWNHFSSGKQTLVTFHGKTWLEGILKKSLLRILTYVG